MVVGMPMQMLRFADDTAGDRREQGRPNKHARKNEQHS